MAFLWVLSIHSTVTQKKTKIKSIERSLEGRQFFVVFGRVCRLITWMNQESISETAKPKIDNQDRESIYL